MVDKSKIRLEPATNFDFVFDAQKYGEKQIIVMMSGGVDSSVTALILKEAGWNVCGITLRIPVAEKCDIKRSCCGVEAAYVARQLEIPHYYLDVRDAFYQCVIKPFQDDYKNGITPSPCVDCNEIIKFDLAWDAITENLGIKHLATGHYAKTYFDSSGYHLAMGRDKKRDQSYFLYGIKADKLPFLHFPLEPYTKDETRAIARDAMLRVASKQDSMELCFAGEGDYRNAIGESSGRRGDIVDTSGKRLKEHDGIENFTIGQRKGLGVSAPYPLYVININPVDNSVILGTYEDGLIRSVVARKLNILETAKAYVGNNLYGKIRSTGKPKLCNISELDNDRIKVDFEKEFFTTAPGQKLVLYDEFENVILGATILECIK